MFGIINKSKPIVLNCYTDDYGVYKFAKIQKSSVFIPNWWKDLKKIEESADDNNFRTMRGCPGFIELFKKSFVYPMWCDLEVSSIETANDDSQLFQNSPLGNDIVTTHSPIQYNDAFRPGFKHIKLNSPWFFQTKEDVDWIVVPAFWNFESKNSDIFVPPAIDNYKRQHSTTWQMFIKTDGSIVHFSSGEPLVHLIPKTDRKVIVNCQYSEEMVCKLSQKTKNIHFKKSYYKKLKMNSGAES